MAGASETCSHVSAILYWVETMVEMKEMYHQHQKKMYGCYQRLSKSLKNVCKTFQDLIKPVVATKLSFQSPLQEDKGAFLSAISVEKE